MHVVHDQLATGRRLQIPTVIDTFWDVSPATDPRFGNRGEAVVQALERICSEVGCRKAIRVTPVFRTAWDTGVAPKLLSTRIKH
tara:strand:+ start:805 stop:1056 length:252 start_codon:yes stop_codon:yes gene_type:complete